MGIEPETYQSRVFCLNRNTMLYFSCLNAMLKVQIVEAELAVALVSTTDKNMCVLL